MLKLFKRDLFLCTAVTFFVMLCALAWGRPFFGTGFDSVHAQARKAQVFQGSVFRSGDQYLLRDTSGQEFTLDDQAQQYLGKTVTITGRFEGISKSIHVVRIEPAS